MPSSGFMTPHSLDFSELPEPARRELLMVLMAGARVRADLIGQMHRRSDTRDLAEALIELEENDFARAAVIDVLRRSLPNR
jgi:hypothetical protein